MHVGRDDKDHHCEECGRLVRALFVKVGTDPLNETHHLCVACAKHLGHTLVQHAEQLELRVGWFSRLIEIRNEAVFKLFGIPMWGGSGARRY